LLCAGRLWDIYINGFNVKERMEGRGSELKPGRKKKIWGKKWGGR
jgi:hypothetical protein